MKNKDNVRKKNKLSKTQQDFIQLREAEEKEEYNRPTTVFHSEDYKMYENQIKWEIRRKTRMYDKAIEEKKKEKEIMTQAKPCPGSQRIVNYRKTLCPVPLCLVPSWNWKNLGRRQNSMKI